MSEASPPLSYTSNHAHQQYYLTSPVSLKTTYHSCVFTQCLTAIFKYNTCSNATCLETLLGEKQNLQKVVSMGTEEDIPWTCKPMYPLYEERPGCHCLHYKHCTTAAFLQLNLSMFSECNQIMVYTLQ
jgi:hypothetical protein